MPLSVSYHWQMHGTSSEVGTDNVSLRFQTSTIWKLMITCRFHLQLLLGVQAQGKSLLAQNLFCRTSYMKVDSYSISNTILRTSKRQLSILCAKERPTNEIPNFFLLFSTLLSFFPLPNKACCLQTNNQSPCPQRKMYLPPAVMIHSISELVFMRRFFPNTC